MPFTAALALGLFGSNALPGLVLGIVGLHLGARTVVHCARCKMRTEGPPLPAVRFKQ